MGIKKKESTPVGKAIVAWGRVLEYIDKLVDTGSISERDHSALVREFSAIDDKVHGFRLQLQDAVRGNR